MCLAIPMKLIERSGDCGVAELDSVRTKIMLTLVPAARIGDHVIVHAGYALSVVDEEEAQRTFELLQQVRESGT